MKKTLIALMALAGVASADITGAELDSWLTDALSDRQGSKYTLTFTLSDSYNFYVYGGYAPIVTLNSDGWKLIHQQAKYIGLADSTAADYRPSDSYACRSNSTVNSIDMDTCGADGTADYNGWIYEYTGGVGSSYIGGTTITVYGADSNSIIYLTTADGSRTIELQRDTFINPNGLNFGYDNAKAFKSASIKFDHATYTIPEPATATLSLLALAGLAARRRRH